MNDVIIIGGGVAAFSAALYAARRGLSALVIGKDLGGQANSSDVIENFPGIVETSGFDLVNKIKRQAEKFGAKFLVAEADRIKKIDRGFVVSAFGRQYKALSLILAFGKTPMDLKVSGEQELKGKGVSYCATCDAPLYRNKTVAVVGIGDLNLEAALLCAKYSKKVYLLSKNDKFIGHPSLQRAVKNKPNIELTPFVQIEAVVGEGMVQGLKLSDLRSGQRKTLKIDGLFVELGFVINSDIVKGLVALDQNGQVVINADQSTTLPGIFAAGDLTNRPYKQAVISAGEGAAAALAAYDWLMRKQGGVGLTSDWTQIKRVK
jgi:thioredoxin reductase (NADPH)